MWILSFLVASSALIWNKHLNLPVEYLTPCPFLFELLFKVLACKVIVAYQSNIISYGSQTKFLQPVSGLPHTHGTHSRFFDLFKNLRVTQDFLNLFFKHSLTQYSFVSLIKSQDRFKFSKNSDYFSYTF